MRSVQVRFQTQQEKALLIMRIINMNMRPLRLAISKTLTFTRSFFQPKAPDVIFIHINKTGGSSIETALGLNFQHKTAQEKIADLGIEKWNQSFTFSVVRNPWDKVVSHYHYRLLTKQPSLVERPVDFRTWVKLTYGEQNPFYFDSHLMFMPQLDWITDGNGTVLVKEVLRFEELESDFESKVLAPNHIKATLPHLKKTDRTPYSDYYDDETKKIVAKWFDADIVFFGYCFD